MTMPALVVIGRSEPEAIVVAVRAQLAPAGIAVIQNRRNANRPDRRVRPSMRIEERRDQVSAGGGDRRARHVEVYPARIVVTA